MVAVTPHTPQRWVGKKTSAIGISSSPPSTKRHVEVKAERGRSDHSCRSESQTDSLVMVNCRVQRSVSVPSRVVVQCQRA